MGKVEILSQISWPAWLYGVVDAVLAAACDVWCSDIIIVICVEELQEKSSQLSDDQNKQLKTVIGDLSKHMTLLLDEQSTQTGLTKILFILL